jgi:hypothetical protein
MNLTLMQDGYPGLEHAMPIFPLFKDVAQLEAQSGITYTPTLVVGYGGPKGLDYWLLKNHDALRAATYFGADAIGLSKDLGTLEVGKLADLQEGTARHELGSSLAPERRFSYFAASSMTRSRNASSSRAE